MNGFYSLLNYKHKIRTMEIFAKIGNVAIREKQTVISEFTVDKPCKSNDGKHLV